ncbi:D-2-hydroxyacid dehydrogenase [Photobacterium sp. TY1-4]|uniref:D-2-hydroxyacid dehydrogenase n=1 Tax=Photobacterium sp. TY1-4 TaxID=2899122 RepID=UPI0021C10A51|nr:D-2-hydroxyacid dehydrogenase [Photobacterium sp. TY1-4]UXI01143.1 D-2-hydroxyacid dehydrogenase [Photobacterium sp. TY1-4]
MHKVLIISKQQPRYHQRLSAAQLPGLHLTDVPDEAEIVLADPPLVAPMLADLPALCWMQSTFAGIDALMQPELRQDYQLTNIRGHFGPLIAEYVLGYTLDYTRHLSQYRRQQRRGQWQPLPYTSLATRTLVILGTGSIGTHLAGVAKAMGMTVVGVNRSGRAEPAHFDRIYPLTQLTDALAQADVLVSTLPATPQTDRLLNRDSLSHCRETLVFNVGRGNSLCETGLLAAINAGQVAHAFLDVFNQEPLPPHHPFWQHPQITVTPHIAAESFPEQVFETFRDNYLRYTQQQPLHHLINFEHGY